MKLFIRTKPNARENRVQRLDPNHLVVFIKEPPRQGRANEALIETLAKYFNVTQDAVSIVSGRRSKLKIIQIDSFPKAELSGF